MDTVGEFRLAVKNRTLVGIQPVPAMSLQPQTINPVPALTAQIAQAALPNGNPYMLLRDKLGTIYTDELFADLFQQRGQPALAP